MFFVEGHNWMWLWAIKYLLLPFILRACQGADRFVLSRVKKLSLEPIYAKTADWSCDLYMCCKIFKYYVLHGSVLLPCRWMISHHWGMPTCRKIVTITFKSYSVRRKAWKLLGWYPALVIKCWLSILSMVKEIFMESATPPPHNCYCSICLLVPVSLKTHF